MLLERLSDMQVVIHKAQSFCKEGDIINIDHDRYVVKTMLEILQEDAEIKIKRLAGIEKSEPNFLTFIYLS